MKHCTSQLISLKRRTIKEICLSLYETKEYKCKSISRKFYNLVEELWYADSNSSDIINKPLKASAIILSLEGNED